MKFYYVKPKEEGSHSRRWFADDCGLKAIENKYRNYGKDPSNIIDRWNEFEAVEAKQIWFDFGGMMRVNTPEAKETIMDVEVCMPITHVDYFIMSINNKEYSKDGIWQCPSRFHCGVFSYEFRDAAKVAFEIKSKLYEEMIEGFNKEMDRVVQEMGEKGKLIGAKRYHNK